MSEKILVVEEDGGELSIVRKQIQDIDGYQAPTDEQTQEAVDLWMDAHSASYVVPDNGITTQKIHDEAVSLEKLSSALQDQIENMINPDNFNGGSDYLKLQAAIDYAISNDYGTILINRKYDITGHTLDVTKGLYQESTHLRKRLTFFGAGKGMIYKGDTGFMFYAQSFSGDYAFIGMSFVGKASARCSVFDCHTMIRISTYSCCYNYVAWVFDGNDSTGGTDNMQSINNFGDLCTYSTGYYRMQWAWGIFSSGCTVEQCDYGYYGNSGSGIIVNLKIQDCVIEGCPNGAVIIGANGGVTSLSVENCYFEANGSYDIKIDSQYVYGTTICGNKFTPNAGGHGIDIFVRNYDYIIDGNIMTSSVADSSTYLIYVRLDSNLTNIPFIYGINAKTGNGNITNDESVMHDPRIGGYINRLSSYAAGYASADANTIAGYFNDSMVKVSAADSVQNLPSGETGGIIKTHNYDGTAFQEFIGNSSILPKQRVRRSGYGWSEWFPSTPVCFYKTGLGNNATVQLPHAATIKSLVVFYPEYARTADVIRFYPATTVNKGATSFTFWAINSDGSTPSATNIQGYFVLYPVID